MFFDTGVWYPKCFQEESFKNEIIDNLNLFDEFCKENNIKFYLIIVPSQIEVYYNKYPYLLSSLKIEKRNQVVYDIISKLKFPAIYVYDILKIASKKQMVYYKTDFHWTDDGAFIGYKALMELIKKDFKNVKILTNSDFDIKYSNKVRSDWDREFNNGEVMMYQFHDYEKESDKILDTQYRYYEHKDKKNLNAIVIDESRRKEKVFSYNSTNNLKLLQIGTSMNESLLEFVPYSFKNIKYIRIQNIKNQPSSEDYKFIKLYKNEILEYKPDIIVLCLTPLV